MESVYRELSHIFTEISGISTNTKTEIKTLDEIFKKNKVRTVLDIACGVGRHSIPLAKLGYDVTGIDYAREQIENAKTNSTKENVKVKFLVKNANDFNFNKKFDAAICMWTTLGEEPLIYKKVIKNVFSSLRKNGIFVVDNTSWENIPKSKKKTRVDEFKKNGLVVKRIMHDKYTENFRVREGIFHIKGKEYKHFCITHILKTKNWIREFKEAGFKNFEIYYNYKKKKTKNPDRIVIIAKK